MDLVAKFEGRLPDRNVLPAFEGAQSIEGISRTLTLVTHYVVTGAVRKRWPFDQTVRVVLEPSRPGSFEAVFSFITDRDTVITTTVLGTIGLSIFTDVVYDTVKLVTRRLIGSDHTPATDKLGSLAASRPGELEALGEAVEPSLRKAHTVINNGAGTVFLIAGDNNIVRLDGRSKDYISNTLHSPDVQTRPVSVGMLNANTRNGRVYDPLLGRTIPVHVIKSANPRTLSALAQSLERYSYRAISPVSSEIFVTLTAEIAPDGTPKKYLIRDAFFE